MHIKNIKYTVIAFLAVCLTQFCSASMKSSQPGFVRNFMDSSYDLVSRPFVALKEYSGYSQEEKAAARKIIVQLEQDKVILKRQYDQDIRESFGSHHTALLTDEYNAQVAALNRNIREQKIITGEVMSTRKKLIIGGVAVAAATIGGVLVYKYFTKQPIVPTPLAVSNKVISNQTQTPKPPIVPEQPIIDNENRMPKTSGVESKQRALRQQNSAQKATLKFPDYVSPPLVQDTENMDELYKRLNAIRKQERVLIEGRTHYNPNYNKDDELMAMQAIRDAYPYRPYSSPPLVEDPSNVDAMRRRLRLIEDQKDVFIDKGFVKNPNWNETDWDQARKDFWRAVAFQEGIEKAEPKAVEKGKTILSAKYFPEKAKFPAYESPDREKNTLDIPALEERLKKIQQQKLLILSGREVQSRHYNEADELAAQEDIIKAQKQLEKIKKMEEEIQKGKPQEPQVLFPINKMWWNIKNWWNNSSEIE